MNEYSRAPDLYRYRGIMYTYDELRKAHRKQQLTIQAAIDCGDYNTACEAANLDAREFLSQIAEQQTGDKRTLTPRRKCGIIKAIRRYANRWKRKQEGKTMNRNEIEQLAAEIRNSDTWIPELLEQLCEYAGMLDEWNKADGETFEEIAYAAAKKLNVEI